MTISKNLIHLQCAPVGWNLGSVKR